LFHMILNQPGGLGKEEGQITEGEKQARVRVRGQNTREKKSAGPSVRNGESGAMSLKKKYN